MKSLNTQFYFSFLILVLFFFGCKKENNANYNNQYTGQKYSDASGNFVVINNPKWYTAPGGFGGSANLKASGYSNADRLTIRSYGDGLTTDYPITLNSDETYSFDVGIVNFVSTPTGNFQESTVIKSIRGTDTLSVSLNSGDMHF